jgi:hypothetical protein
MAQLVLNVGENANDGTGDTLRDAMIKVNTNFTDIYGSPGFDLTTIQVTGNEIRATRTNDDLVFAPAGSGAVVFPALTISGNNIIGTRSNEDINLLPAGTGNVIFGAIQIAGTTLSSTDSTTININEGLIVDGTLSVSGATTFSGAISAGTGTTVGNITLANGSITDSSGAISFGNENLTTTGTLQVDGTATLGAMTVTSLNITGTLAVDNLNIFDSTISSDSNADIRFEPGGTGTVVIDSLTIDDNINITDNEIKTTQTNSNLVISPAGTGQVSIAKADINSGSIDGTAIGATTPAAGTFTTLTVTSALTLEGITLDDNTVKTNSSNANLELTGNGTGSVTISGLTFPTSDGSANQFMKTDGSGNLAFATAGATLNNSDIADATTTVATSTTSVLNTFAVGTYRSAKYFISIADATNSRFEVVEANVTHDGSDAYITAFGSTTDHTGPLATFSADVSGGNVRLLTTNTSADSCVFKFQRIAIDV